MSSLTNISSLITDFTGLLSVWNDHNNTLYGFDLFGMIIITYFTDLLSVWNDHNNTLYGFTLCLESS